MVSGFYNKEKLSLLEKAFEGYGSTRSENDGVLSFTVKSGGNELRAEISALAVLGFKGLAQSEAEGFYFGIYHPTEAEFSRLLSDISDILCGKACAVNIKGTARHDIMKLERTDTPSEGEAKRIAGEKAEGAEVRFNYWDSAKNAVFKL